MGTEQMRTAIVDLDQGDRRRVRDSGERGVVAALFAASSMFALSVWVGQSARAPDVAATEVDATERSVASALVPRGEVLHPLTLPARADDVDLAVLPDRLANEAQPWTLRQVVTIRGFPGVASVEGPAVIAWTESGIAYWLRSSTRSTADLIRLADELR